MRACTQDGGDISIDAHRIGGIGCVDICAFTKVGSFGSTACCHSSAFALKVEVDQPSNVAAIRASKCSPLYRSS